MNLSNKSSNTLEKHHALYTSVHSLGRFWVGPVSANNFYFTYIKKVS